MKVILGGDYCIPDQQMNNRINLDPELVNIFHSADLRVINLECPITHESTPITKTGPSLKGPQFMLELAKELNIDLFTLANNHIMDFGDKGLIDTINLCKINGFATVGVGENKAMAAAPFVLKKNFESLAIINFAENEWASASSNTPGSNPYDIIECAQSIREAAHDYDHVLVIIHGGHEYFPLPSPRMVKEYRFFIDCGASAIVAHHTHTMSGYEIYKGVPIFYGLGNFFFKKKSSFNCWYFGLVASLHFKKGKVVSFDRIFTEFTRDFSELRICRGNELAMAMDQMSKLNKVINSPENLQIEWEKFVHSRANDYFWFFHPLNAPRIRFFFRILRRLKLLRAAPNKIRAAQLLNRIRCESHLDAFKVILRNIINEDCYTP